MAVDDSNFCQGRRPSAFSDLFFAVVLASPVTFSVAGNSGQEMARMVLRILAKFIQLLDL